MVDEYNKDLTVQSISTTIDVNVLKAEGTKHIFDMKTNNSLEKRFIEQINIDSNTQKDNFQLFKDWYSNTSTGLKQTQTFNLNWTVSDKTKGVYTAEHEINVAKAAGGGVKGAIASAFAKGLALFSSQVKRWITVDANTKWSGFVVLKGISGVTKNIDIKNFSMSKTTSDHEKLDIEAIIKDSIVITAITESIKNTKFTINSNAEAIKKQP